MLRVVFVDDEPHVLAALKRMLRAHRADWDMEFVDGGAAALAALGARAFDVLVTDIRMPGMDGVALLTEVRARFPGVVRIVLSGYSDPEVVLRTVPVAHQFLAKPCDPARLADAVSRTHALHALLADETLQRAAGGVHALPSAPRLYAGLTRALGDPRVSVRRIAALVEGDMAMSARVLQLVNSAFFGLPRRIVNLQAAIALLGIVTLRSLVLSIEVFQTFPGVPAGEGLSVDALQRHALRTAAIARRLVAAGPPADMAFTAGLLHDVGKLLLALRLPRELARVVARAREEALPFHAAETAEGGPTHALLGAYLLGLWGLPYPIVEAVAFHHAPALACPRAFETPAVVYVANALAQDDGAALDLDYLAALGVADRVPGWRALADETVVAG